MVKISVVIPFDKLNLVTMPDIRRHRSFDWIVERWLAYSKISDHEISCSWSSGEVDGKFSRSKARNLGYVYASRDKADLVIFADADTFCDFSQIDQAIELALQDRWGYLYTIYYNLTDDDTKKYLKNSPSCVPIEPKEYNHRIEDSPGSLLVCPTNMFLKAGYDERFSGWGGEDNAFRLAMTVMCGAPFRVEGNCYHLEHDRLDADFNQPDWPKNRELLREYERATSKQQMRLVLEEAARCVKF